jgi:mannose/fructose/N-acetylgalactosamine-specific phosphotransferase system component IIB
MSIVLTRIDNRLIHGQVLESWVPFTHADCIVVANDQVAGLPFQRVLMAAAVPRGIRLVIGSLEEVARLFAASELESSRVLLLFSTSADARQALRQGILFTELNLGNMHGGDGKMRFSCTIALDPEDIDNLKEIEEAGVRIVAQCIPSDRERGWRKLVREPEV